MWEELKLLSSTPHGSTAGAAAAFTSGFFVSTGLTAGCPWLK